MEFENKVPVIGINALCPSNTLPADHPDTIAASTLLLNAARDWGFIYIQDHGVPENLIQELEDVSTEFFQLPLETKEKIKVGILGKYWKPLTGYFGLGGELTDGKPDIKEGIHFGVELDKREDGTPLPINGRNLWPEEIPRFKTVVLEYMRQLSELGHALMRGFAIGLKLHEHYFKKYFGEVPTILLGLLNYPKMDQEVEGWGVGEHTDFGFLTILKTDHHPGLQVLSPDSKTWIDAPPIKGTFLINLGDQLEIATSGMLRATPHRVYIQRNEPRLSWPFFFQLDWETRMSNVDPGESSVLKEWHESEDKRVVVQREMIIAKWSTVQQGKYGDLILAKARLFFPDVFEDVSDLGLDY